MGRTCAECDYFLSNSKNSRNQWFKGNGYSRCRDCVLGGGCNYECGLCYKTFNSQNELNMLMQVHRSRNVSCPVCGETRFRSGASAVQHVESGYCSGCRGRDNAKMECVPSDEHSSTGDREPSSIPDNPYNCSRSFRQLSQLLQRQDQKHGNLRMLQY